MRRQSRWPRIWLGESMRGLSRSPWAVGNPWVWEGANGTVQIAEHRLRFCDHAATAGRSAWAQVSSKRSLSCAGIFPGVAIKLAARDRGGAGGKLGGSSDTHEGQRRIVCPRASQSSSNEPAASPNTYGPKASCRGSFTMAGSFAAANKIYGHRMIAPRF